MLYPLLFNSIQHPKIWGEEVWTLCESSTIVNGFLESNTLQEIVEVYLDELLGQHVFAQYNTYFPLLFKIIDAREDLSVQVHPDDASAKANGLTNGKTEMWYIISESPDASVILGWNDRQTESSLRHHIETGSLMTALQSFNVKKADVVYIPAGTVHTLQRHTKVIEIQQNSDTTYRLYDYNRINERGEQRPLHIEEAIRCCNMDIDARPPFSCPDEKIEVSLIEDRHFVTRRVIIKKKTTCNYSDYDSFVALICLEGGLDIVYEDMHLQIKPYEHVLIPACVDDITLSPSDLIGSFLEVHVP